MTKYNIEKLQRTANIVAEDFWVAAKNVFGVDIGQLPIIIMNPRLTAVAGRAWLDLNKVDLSCYLMDKYPDNFRLDTIPHELCHHIANRLYGDRGHGNGWKYTMVKMGVEPIRLHSMETLYQAKQRGIY